MTAPKNAPEPKFRLDTDDLESITWRRISEHLNKRLSKLREQNDGDLPDEETAKLRGRIAELKLILSFSKDADRPG